MKKTTKIALILAVVLILVGGAVFTLASMAADWNYETLKYESFEVNKYQYEEEVQNITLKTDTANVYFYPSSDGELRVECYEHIKAKHTVSVVGDTLSIELQDARKWYDHIGISFQSPEITVYLPKKTYDTLAVRTTTGDTLIKNDLEFQNIEINQSTGRVNCYASAAERMKIRTSTGEIHLKDGKVGALELEVSTGDSTLENITCKSLESVDSTGDVTLKNTVVDGALSVKRSTGRVHFWDCDAAEIFIKTDTGDVRGTLLTEKIFFTETDTGSVTTPKTASGGKCEIITDTGDIYVEIK